MGNTEAKCPSCGGNYFISRRMTYPIPNVKEVHLVYCAKCGHVVGVVSSK